MTTPTDVTPVDAPVVKPGYLTTEFWQTNLVHLFSAVSAILVFYNVNLSHLTVIQGLIPMVAIGASLIAQLAYGNKRTAVKVAALTKWGEVAVERAKLDAAPLLPAVGMLAKSVDPAIYAQAKGTIDAASKAWTEFPAADAVVPDSPDPVADVQTAPADVTDDAPAVDAAPIAPAAGDAAP